MSIFLRDLNLGSVYDVNWPTGEQGTCVVLGKNPTGENNPVAAIDLLIYDTIYERVNKPRLKRLRMSVSDVEFSLSKGYLSVKRNDAIPPALSNLYTNQALVQNMPVDYSPSLVRALNRSWGQPALEHSDSSDSSTTPAPFQVAGNCKPSRPQAVKRKVRKTRNTSS